MEPPTPRGERDARGRHVAVGTLIVAFLLATIVSCERPAEEEALREAPPFKLPKLIGSLTVLGVTVNDLHEDSRAFLREYAIDYLNVIGNDQMFENYELPPWIPVTMLISSDGKILKKWFGPQTEARFLEGIRAAAPDLRAVAESDTLAPAS